MKITCLIENTGETGGCVAGHGLSFYIETAAHRVLFDAGPSGETLMNARKIGIDPGEADIAVLSHGHYDHSGGLADFAALNPSARIYIQRGAGGEHYGFDGPESGYRYIGIDKKLLALPQVYFVDGDLRIDDELALFTVGKRRYPVPSTNDRILRKTGDGYEADDFSHEQNLYVRSGGKKVLLTGCAHAGILNVLGEFIRKFGRSELPQTVLGGFHLMKKEGYGPDDFAGHEELARRLMSFPCVFCTGHCTGREPFERMKAIMGEKIRYISTGQSV